MARWRFAANLGVMRMLERDGRSCEEQRLREAMGMRVRRKVVGRRRYGFIAALILGCPSLSAAQGSAEDELAIRRVIVQTTEAFNAHDAAAFARFYTPDADLVTVRGEVMRGSAAIERWLASIFATRAG